MTFRQMIGLCLLSIGVVCLSFTFHELDYTSLKKSNTKVMTNSPISPTEDIPESLSTYSSLKQRNSRPFFMMGAFLTVIGAALAIHYRD